jgi:hypothetical protein
MTGWYAQRTPGRSARVMIAVTVLALVMLGYVAGGLALFGGSVLAAALAVTLAGMNGLRHLRKLLSGDSIRVVRLDASQYTDTAEPAGRRDTNLVQLDRSEYTEVR